MVAVEMPVGKVKKKMKVANMDDESVKENLAKKERKSKRGQATAPEREASSIDEESLGGMKKKKKNQGKTTVKVEESLNSDGGGEKREKEKKKKNIVTDTERDAHYPDVKENDKGINKKKMKKKLQSEEENAGEIAQGSVKEERGVENEHRKQKKPVEKIVTGEEGEKDGAEKQVGKDEVVTKAKKRKTKALVESTEETEEQIKERKKRQKTTEKKEKKTAKPTEESEDRTVVPKQKSKKSDENEPRLVTLEEETDVVEEVTVKKKAKTKLKAATKEEAKKEGTQQIQRKTKRKKAGKDNEVFNAVTNEEIEEKEIMHKKRSMSTNSVNDITEEQRGEPERKKKKGLKEKRGKVSVQREEEQEGSGIEEREPKKKRRKKASSKGEEEETSLQLKQVMDEGQSMETFATVAGDTKGKKKNRKKSSEVEMKVANEKEAEEGVETKKRKKKKIKLELMDNEEQEDQGVPQMDVVFLSEKTGNRDEVTINQERRLALQMEIDKASQPRIAAKPSGFGQWGTAQFDSSEQQQKFLRLMGGFKKGTQPTGANTGQANMALGKEAQQGMQQALLGEFERAQSRRMDFNGRGAGLGFTAPSNKKFSIDINASRSIHFD